MFFESGILLENHDKKWKAQAFFHHGVTELIKKSKLIQQKKDSRNKIFSKSSPDDSNTVSIPQVNIMTILRTESSVILHKLKLDHLDRENKTTCLLIKVTPDFAFLLFSTLPDLWLKDHSENIRKSLINGFTD
jgi:hypothetical protein